MSGRERALDPVSLLARRTLLNDVLKLQGPVPGELFQLIVKTPHAVLGAVADCVQQRSPFPLAFFQVFARALIGAQDLSRLRK